MTNGQLTFNSTPGTLVIGVLIVLVTAVLAYLGWSRAVKKKSMGWLEILRVLVALCIAITLNQPEWREEFKPDQKPLLAVLYDNSKSMETHDIVDANNQNAQPKSRTEAIAPLLDQKLWEPLKAKMDVLIEPFAPTPDGTDINGALSKLIEQQPRLRSVVLLSDGDWNVGSSPVQAATQLRMKSAPVFAVPTGAETRLPDVWVVSFDAPTFGVEGKPLRLPFVIESSLPREQAITVELRSDAGDLLKKDITLPALGRAQDAITWSPTKTGDAKLTLTIPPVANERYPDNNSLDATVSIRKEELKVLIVETLPRWEYRYMRNAMERDPGVEANTVMFHPGLGKMGEGRGYLSAFPKAEDLTKYDVVFIGDVGMTNDQLSTEHCEELKKLVRDQAAGLVFLPGVQGNQQTLASSPLGELYPVVLDEAQPKGWGSAAPGRFTLTDQGQRSLLTRLEDTDEASARVWNTLPGFQWYAPAMRAKAGAEVLATHSSESSRFGRVPLIVSKTYGSGKILFMGADGAWRWRRGVEDKYHYRFWGQVVRWMAYQRNMASGGNLRLFYSPDRPRTGDVLTLNANALSTGGEPLRDATVVAQITSPSGKVNSLRLLAGSEESWGLFSNTLTPSEPGDYKVTLTCADSGNPINTVISVQGTSREKLGQAARYDVLREIATLTRGKVINSFDATELLKEVKALPDPEVEERRLLLWAHPAWAGLLLLLLTVFWIGRKMAGAF